MNQKIKIAYVLFIGGLTSTTLSACYWQTNKYFASKSKWKVIASELSQEKPTSLSQFTDQQLQKQMYPFKYVTVEGVMSTNFLKVQRSKDGRMGYLVVRSLDYQEEQKEQKQHKQKNKITEIRDLDKKSVIILEGWCPEEHKIEELKEKQSKKIYKGILRQKQKIDFLHEKMKKEDLQKFKIFTYIDLDKSIKDLNVNGSSFNKNYYLELLRPLNSIQHQNYPYQYSVDNFQLPYLTPDKHLSYAIFWGCTSIVGLLSIRKVLRFK